MDAIFEGVYVELYNCKIIFVYPPQFKCQLNARAFKIRPIAMNKEQPGLITIQKFIYLLSDFYYAEFITHLSSVNATLPLKLAKTIRSRLPGFDTHEELCKKIYGSFEKGAKQNFNQLASYTFRLSDVLAQNYPNYLHHNILNVQRMVNEGRGEDANFLSEILLEIAERTDDFQCQVFVLNFLGQQAFIRKDNVTGIKFDTQLSEALTKEKIFVEIQLFTHKALAETRLEKADIEKAKEYLLGFVASNPAAIRILARHSYLLILYQFHLEAFEQSGIGDILEQLEKDLHNQSHVVFPYLLDLRSSLFFMKLNSTLKDLNSKESEREFDALAQHYKAVKYWKTFVNTGQLYLITIQCTRLFDKYESRIYRSDYPDGITDHDEKIVKEYLGKCRAFLKSNVDVVKYAYEVMSYRIVYGVLLIIAGGKNIKAGIEELESVLANYQQVNLNTETDSIFMCLMLGYLSVKDYARCANAFTRYSKSIKGKPVFGDNDARIHAYYYLSQWLGLQSRQYAVKLNLLRHADGGNKTSKSVVEMVEYFKVPA